MGDLGILRMAARASRRGGRLLAMDLGDAVCNKAVGADHWLYQDEPAWVQGSSGWRRRWASCSMPSPSA